MLAKLRVFVTPNYLYHLMHLQYLSCLKAVRPIGGVEVYLYSFLTTAIEGGEGSASRPAAFCPREWPGTRCIGGWVGARAGLERCGKSRPTRIWSPDSPGCSQSLYSLRYAAHKPNNDSTLNCTVKSALHVLFNFLHSRNSAEGKM